MTVPFSEPPPMRIRPAGRADLLALVPYLLGFHPNPDGDLVLLGMRGSKVLVNARTELHAPEELRAGIPTLLVRREDLDGVIIVGYGPPEHGPAITAMAAECAGVGLMVHDVLRVADGRYFCLLCDECAPADGVAFDAAATVTAAQATVAGLVAEPTRDAVATRVAYQPDTATALLAAITGVAETHLARWPDTFAATATLDDLLRGAEHGPLLDDEAATLIVLLAHDPWRDHVWLATEGRPWQVELWCDLTRRCPPSHVAPVACLAAWAAWRSGDTVLARAALDRAVTADQGYSMAALLTDTLNLHLSPATLPWPPGPPPTSEPTLPDHPGLRTPR